MHPTVLDFAQRVLQARDVEGLQVLEVGAYDVNGSVRPLVNALKPALYVGVDALDGPGVDVVVNCEHLAEAMGRSSWDLVISTEMLEHVRDWRACMTELVSVIAPGGLLLLTTRSPGFPYHAFPEDHWRFTRSQMFDILTALGLVTLSLEDDPEPGVLALARRPRSASQVTVDLLADIDADRVKR